VATATRVGLTAMSRSWQASTSKAVTFGKLAAAPPVSGVDGASAMRPSRRPASAGAPPPLPPRPPLPAMPPVPAAPPLPAAPPVPPVPPAPPRPPLPPLPPVPGGVEPEPLLQASAPTARAIGPHER
jgi:hypothetical protein